MTILQERPPSLDIQPIQDLYEVTSSPAPEVLTAADIDAAPPSTRAVRDSDRLHHRLQKFNHDMQHADRAPRRPDRRVRKLAETTLSVIDQSFQGVSSWGYRNLATAVEVEHMARNSEDPATRKLGAYILEKLSSRRLEGQLEFIQHGVDQASLDDAPPSTSIRDYLRKQAAEQADARAELYGDAF